MIVLLLGSGGREHALAIGLAADEGVEELHIAPGNPGTVDLGTHHAIDANSPDAVVALAREVGADLVVVGPEASLVAGVGDAVRAAGFACFGPDAAAAELEGSKAFAKDVMAAARVPTAAARVCETNREYKAALEEFGGPYVVKNDGLAAGKGVVVTRDYDEALAHAKACGRVVIEEYLDGPEVSLFVVCDGKRGVPLEPAQDFKRVGERDQGPNTGGMGAYTPLGWGPPRLVDEVMEHVVQPTLDEMNRRGTPFVGLLYVGLAVTRKGLRVVEFNARFGDPETQAVLARLQSPLGGLLYAAATGELDQFGPLSWSPDAAVIVVIAAEGYPGMPVKGGLITLPEPRSDAYVVQAGTALDGDRLIASGGRVLGVVGRGADLGSARLAAYDMVEQVQYADGFWRNDIALAASRGEIG